VCFLNVHIPVDGILFDSYLIGGFCRKNTECLYVKTGNRCLNGRLSKAIDVSRDKMKRRAFHLRSLIDNVKNKKARQEVIKEYVSLISQMSYNN
jgi:hypothetical protein